ncbi:MAG: acetyl-CoA carboxylase biotin carboxylase subunit [Firmicutes bacterium]|nr:acetyl-CoA carboxylase biotin carboxylase subunit [Bacillota bacterium]
MQNKVLIANRGEIALRIIRACKELGIHTVAVYSTADKDSLQVKFADEAICIGSEQSSDSYLQMNRIISAAISSGCNAIHPGYGFLSENDKFASIVEECNLIFIGPSSQVIANLGNKAMARKIAKQNHIPIIEGSDGAIDSAEEGMKLAGSIGYPVILKALNGGGGRGMSIIWNDTEFPKLFQQTVMEAKANFGDSLVYLEKYIENARHIEIQIIADKFGNVVHLGERDCSMQRRNQKVIEESPSPIMTPLLRRNMGLCAVHLAKAVKYENAGTVEFIVDKEGKYFFMEMNTRIQVEHPVTEMETGVDLVKEQLRIAFDNPLSIKQRDVHLKGHTIECRINAEDTFNNFRPSPGLIKNIVFPGGNGVRLDTHIYNGYVVPSYYDSMLAKLIVHADTRKEAIRKMRVALEQFIIDGIITNIDFLYVLMHNPEFVKGNYNTSFIQKLIKEVTNG